MFLTLFSHIELTHLEMADLVHIDLLGEFLHVIGFVPLPGLAIPEYIESEIVQEETSDGVDTYAVQRSPNLHASSYSSLISSSWQGKCYIELQQFLVFINDYSKFFFCFLQSVLAHLCITLFSLSTVFSRFQSYVLLIA